MCKIKGSIASLGLALISCNPLYTAGAWPQTELSAQFQESEGIPDMSGTAFPDGWKVLTGVLGSDITTTATVSVTGGIGIVWPSTASNDAELVSDWIPAPDRGSTGALATISPWISVALVVRASSVAANKDLKVLIETADKNRTTITSDTLWAAGPLETVDTWQTIGKRFYIPSSARWVRVKISRPTDLDFNLYLDRVEIKELPAFKLSTRTTATAFSSTWANVDVDYAPLTYNTVRYDGTADKLLINLPGLYQINAHLELGDPVVDGDIYGIRLAIEPGQGAATVYVYGTSLFVSANYTPGDSLGLSVSGMYFFHSASTTPNDQGKISVQAAYLAGSGAFYENATVSVARITDR